MCQLLDFKISQLSEGGRKYELECLHTLGENYFVETWLKNKFGIVSDELR